MRFAKALLLTFVVSGCDPAVTKPREQPAEPIATAWTPPRGAQTSGDCWTRVEALSEAARSAVVAEFRRRNGEEWNVAVDPFSGRVTHATRPSVAQQSEGAFDENAERFVRRNADVLGLTPAELSSLAWAVVGDGLLRRDHTAYVDATTRISTRPGKTHHDSIYRGADRQDRGLLSVHLSGNGRVVRISCRGAWALPEPECGDVKLSASEAMRVLREDCVSRPPANAAHERKTLLICPADDVVITSVDLGFFNFGGGTRTRELRRAYRFGRLGEDWYVDAATGELEYSQSWME